jgi:hypothetical protein
MQALAVSARVGRVLRWGLTPLWANSPREKSFAHLATPEQVPCELGSACATLLPTWERLFAYKPMRAPGPASVTGWPTGALPFDAGC